MFADMKQARAPAANVAQSMPAQAPARQTLNGGAAVQAHAELGRALNSRPAVVAQGKLAQSLQDVRPQAVTQRQDIDDEDLTQMKIAQRDSLSDDELTQPMPVQRAANTTGMPDQLKAGIESLSGMSMDSVRVHYNSSQPAALQAHAYAQGTDIHVAPGQEQHLPHEAWHVVQQAQGRVQSTMQMQGTAINDDRALEDEADAMGAKAASMLIGDETAQMHRDIANSATSTMQRQVVINAASYGTMSEVADDDAAWAQYFALNPARRRAFRWLLRSSSDFQMHEVAALAPTVDWIVANGLEDDPIFANVAPRDMTSMSFLVKENVYANWADRAQAIAFLRTLTYLNVSDFAHRYKSYYHLWRRFEDAGDNNPNERVQEAMLNIEGALIEPNAQPEQQAGTAGDKQAYIEALAKAGKLRFKNSVSAAGHIIKHGSYLQGGAKITGEEAPQDLGAMGTDYIAHANYVVANGVPGGIINAPDGLVYRYDFRSPQGGDFRALVQYETGANAAYLLSYFPSEDQNFVMDL